MKPSSTAARLDPPAQPRDSTLGSAVADPAELRAGDALDLGDLGWAQQPPPALGLLAALGYLDPLDLRVDEFGQRSRGRLRPGHDLLVPEGGELLGAQRIAQPGQLVHRAAPAHRAL